MGLISVFIEHLIGAIYLGDVAMLIRNIGIGLFRVTILYCNVGNGYWCIVDVFAGGIEEILNGKGRITNRASGFIAGGIDEDRLGLYREMKIMICAVGYGAVDEGWLRENAVDTIAVVGNCGIKEGWIRVSRTFNSKNFLI